MAPNGTLTARADDEPPVSVKPGAATAMRAFTEAREAIDEHYTAIERRRALLTVGETEAEEQR